MKCHALFWYTPASLGRATADCRMSDTMKRPSGSESWLSGRSHSSRASVKVPCRVLARIGVPSALVPSGPMPRWASSSAKVNRVSPWKFGAPLEYTEKSSGESMQASSRLTGPSK
jgi:hypothetical protein